MISNSRFIGMLFYWVLKSITSRDAHIAGVKTTVIAIGLNQCYCRTEIGAYVQWDISEFIICAACRKHA